MQKKLVSTLFGATGLMLTTAFSGVYGMKKTYKYVLKDRSRMNKNNHTRQAKIAFAKCGLQRI
jgi:hypothetical protein